MNSRTRVSTKVVLLGTGTPLADPMRSGPSIAVVVNRTPYIVDFGPGIVRRAVAAYEAGIEELALPKLSRAFVTHLHSDHTAGYPDLIFTPWVMGREDQLQVYGPPGIQEMTDHILSAYQEDIRERLEGLEPANRTGYQVQVCEIESGLVYQDENVRVEAFPVSHGSWPAYGYKFYTIDRTIVISGDTAPADSCIDAYRGCDVLVHEVYSSLGFEKISPVWQRYHSKVHMSARELAEIMTEVKPGLLVLYHQLFFGATEKELLQEIIEIYKGEVVSGKDLEVY